jgi:hypothetical protein
MPAAGSPKCRRRAAQYAAGGPPKINQLPGGMIVRTIDNY